MPFKKGQSGNPQGRALTIARKLVDAGINPSENVYIPILDKRDPAKELIKLADKASDKDFKRGIWEFLFKEKYKAIRIVAKPIKAPTEAVMSDADMLAQLEGNRPVESNGKGLGGDAGSAADNLKSQTNGTL